MSPSDPDIDWVTARHQCSLHSEFAKLKRDLERDTKIRRDLAPVDRASEVAYKEDGNSCSVIRVPRPTISLDSDSKNYSSSYRT